MTATRGARGVIALLSLMLGACVERSTTSPESWRPNDVVLGVSTSAAPLVGTAWSLRTLTDLPVGAARDTVRPLRFHAGAANQLQLSASLGCNALGGTADTVGTRLRVRALQSTRIGCEEALATLEAGYAMVLGEIAYFGVRADTLWLYDAGLRLRARYHAVR